MFYGRLKRARMVKGWTTERLARFGARFNELINEFYDEREVSEYHLNQRLEQIGFKIGPAGEVFAWQNNDGKFFKPEEVPEK